MSTTSTSEYGVKSAKGLLEQGREPVGSGEIDASQVLNSGVKRERKQAALANVKPRANLASDIDEKQEEEETSPVVLPSPTGFTDRLQFSVEARRKRKALADEERVRRARAEADAEAGEAGAREMLRPVQAQMAAQQQQMQQMVAAVASSLADRRSAAKGELAQAAMLAAMSPASQVSLPRTEFEELKEEFAPGLGELLKNGGEVETVDKGGSFVFLDDALSESCFNRARWLCQERTYI